MRASMCLVASVSNAGDDAVVKRRRGSALRQAATLGRAPSTSRTNLTATSASSCTARTSASGGSEPAQAAGVDRSETIHQALDCDSESNALFRGCSNSRSCAQTHKRRASPQLG